MGIKLDSDGTYVVTYSKRHPVTRSSVNLRRKGFKSKSEAQRAFNQMIIEVEEKFRRKQVPDWSAAVQKFLEHCKARDLTGKTVEDYGLCLHAHTSEEWSERLVDTISTEEIRSLMKRRLGHKSISQQKALLKMIRGVFTCALESGDVQRNPTPHLIFKSGDKIRGVLTEANAKHFLEKARELETEWFPVWAAALYSGMRNGELYALTWDKVSFETKQITVDCSWNPIDGFKSTKSGDDRLVDIAPPLLNLLKIWRIERDDSEFVLPRLDKWKVGEQARELRRFLMGIGIKPIRFHDLRATWATMMLSKGVEPIKVMKMGGWKDISTMMIYARKAGVDIRGAASVLPDLHSSPGTPGKLLKMGIRTDL